MDTPRMILACLVTLFSFSQASSQTMSLFGKTSGITDSLHADSLTVRVFVDGSARSAVSDSADGTKSVAGSIGVEYIRPSFRIRGLMNAQATMDTMHSSYGSTLLNPATGDKFPCGLIEVSFRSKLPKLVRFYGDDVLYHAYLSIANSTWENEGTVKNLSVLGIGFLVGQEWVGSIANQDAGIGIEAGIAARWIVGNATMRDEYLDATLGAHKTFFPGFEFGLRLIANRIVGAAQFYYLYSRSKARIEGLTKGQFTAGLSISVPLFESTEKL